MYSRVVLVKWVGANLDTTADLAVVVSNAVVILHPAVVFLIPASVV